MQVFQGVSLPPVDHKGRGMPRPYGVFRYLLYNEVSVYIRQGRAGGRPTGCGKCLRRHGCREETFADAAALRAKPEASDVHGCTRRTLLQHPVVCSQAVIVTALSPITCDLRKSPYGRRERGDPHAVDKKFIFVSLNWCFQEI